MQGARLLITDTPAPEAGLPADAAKDQQLQNLLNDECTACPNKQTDGFYRRHIW